MSDPADEAIEQARAEAKRMRAVAARGAPDAAVKMSVEQFAKLADLIDMVVDVAEDRFDAPIDGIRFWIPLPVFEAERARWQRTGQWSDALIA